MVSFKAVVSRFEKMGEKTGWYYLVVDEKTAHKLKPGMRKSFRVKGALDDFNIKQTALVPMGDGSFILPFNAQMRKATGKGEGDHVSVQLAFDDSEIPLDETLLLCLADDPVAEEFFNSLTPGHQRYFSNWIREAKTTQTRDQRIALAVNALSRGLDFGEMLREKKRLTRG